MTFCYDKRAMALSVHDTLEELGLNDNEIAVYLQLLRLQTAPASVLAKQTRLQRSTAQYTCQQLQKKGIVAMARKGNTYLYTAEQPEKLLLLLQRKQEELAKREEDVHRIIGSLRGLMHPEAAMPKIRFYEGREGVERAYEEVLEDLQQDDEILSYVNPLKITEETRDIADVLQSFIQKRVRKKVRTRIIAPDMPVMQKFRELDEQMMRETRCIDASQFNFAAAEIFIYRNKMYAMTGDKGLYFAYIVENDAIAGMHRIGFETAWQHLH